MCYSFSFSFVFGELSVQGAFGASCLADGVSRVGRPGQVASSSARWYLTLLEQRQKLKKHLGPDIDANAAKERGFNLSTPHFSPASSSSSNYSIACSRYYLMMYYRDPSKGAVAVFAFLCISLGHSFSNCG